MVLVKAMLCIEDMAPKLSDFFEKCLPGKISTANYKATMCVGIFNFVISEKIWGGGESVSGPTWNDECVEMAPPAMPLVLGAKVGRGLGSVSQQTLVVLVRGQQNFPKPRS